MKRSVFAATAVLSLLASGLSAQAASGSNPRGCAAPAAGGEWRSYNHDLANSRNQPAEKTITPANASTLAPAWVFSGGSGTFDATPVIADGCLYAASSSGVVFSLNAQTGEVVWKTKINDPVQSSPTVVGGRVFVSVTKSSQPYEIALDQATGEPIWRTQLDKQFGSDTFSSPAAFNGMLLVGVSGAGAEAGTTICPGPAASQFGCGGGAQSRLRFRGVYVLLNQRTGRILHRDHVISDADFKQGFAGGGVWSTAAVDTVRQRAYIGTGNPFNAHEHPHTNALLAIDVDPRHRAFGHIVAAYHGTNDLYVPQGTYKPVCGVYVDVFTCDPPDFDFGASPQLFTDAKGRRMVGDLQKAGVYHAALRDSMEPGWQTIVGGPFGQFGGEATASWDGHSLFAAGNAPGLMVALAPTDGARSWVQPIADGIHFSSVTTAGGVTYVTDTRGIFDAWDSATGTPLLLRSLGQDTGQTPYQQFSGGESIAVARHTVYVPAGSSLVAYRVPVG
jgi:polyvinyl alcohol dehydrogenase (cytochrome)